MSNIKEWNILKIQEELSNRGLDINGTQSDLILRLQVNLSFFSFLFIFVYFCFLIISLGF